MAGPDLEQPSPRKRGNLKTGKRYLKRGRVISVIKNAGTSFRDSFRSASAPDQYEDVIEHLIGIDELAAKYETKINMEHPNRSFGLTKVEAALRLQEEGRNELNPPKPQNPVLQYLKLLTEPLTAMLLAAAVLSLASQAASDDSWTPTYLGAVLFIVVTANTIIDFWQARKSEAMVKSLSSMAPAMTTVLRDGSAVQIKASELARGDIVMVHAGDKVPADIRLIKVTDMTVDNSNLTGEGDPQQRAVSAGHEAVLEASNLAFMGTTVVNGKGFGVVIRRGNLTVLGKISSLAGAKKDDMTSPLTQEIQSFVIITGGIAFILAILLFAVGLAVDVSFVNALSLAIGIFVAFALTGMPMLITMLLTYASKELSKYHVMVKNLHGMDTLGAITLLCSDKTGTLTMNVMTVVELWRYGQTESNVSMTPSQIPVDEDKGLIIENDNLLLCMAICNSAHFVRSHENMALPIPDKETIGDATETAMLRYTQEYTDIDELRMDIRATVEVPFNSDRKTSAGVYHRPHANGVYTVFLKGAPERVLRRCSHYKRTPDATELTPMDEDCQAAFQNSYENMAGKGQRVIACAMLELDAATYPEGHKFTAETCPDENLVFLGLVALQDPPKPGVAQAVDECGTAGIQVMMITGDHPLTAEAIAREVHIIKGRTKAEAAAELGIPIEQVRYDQFDAVVLHGETLLTMNEDEWAEALSKKEVVFARTSPEQKLEIVTRAQAMGHVVAMTGDGVNDSPALRRADMGIAMAITGSEVSREAASLVLLDDNFTSVVEGIRRGRIIFASMKKAICYTLSHITGEVVPAILLIIIGLPLGMSPFLVLFVDLGTEIAPGLSFAFEKGDDDAMLKPPRRAVVPHDVLLNPGEESAVERDTRLEVLEANEQDLEDDYDQEASGDDATTTRDTYSSSSKPSGLHQSSSGGSLGGESQPHKRKNGLYKFLDKRVVRTIYSLVSGKRLRRKVNPGDEQLVDAHIFRFSFLQTGAFSVTAALLVYFVTFNHYGVPPSELVGAVPKYFPANNGDVFEYNGRRYLPDEQAQILASVQSAYYFTIAVMQFFTAYILKATDGHIFTSKAAWRNKTTYYAFIISLAIAFFVTHTPGVQYILESARFPIWVLVIPVGVGFLHLVFESLKRKARRARAARAHKNAPGSAAVTDPTAVRNVEAVQRAAAANGSSSKTVNQAPAVTAVNAANAV